MWVLKLSSSYRLVGTAWGCATIGVISGMSEEENVDTSGGPGSAGATTVVVEGV